MADPQFPIEVTGLTFDELYDQFRTLAKRVLPNWNVDELNDPVVYLAENYLQSIARGNYFANLMANEFSLSSAVDRRSVVAHARRLNYTPSTGQPATVNCLLTYNSATTTRILEPYSVRVSTTPASEDEEAVYFENAAQLVLAANTTQQLAQFVEGKKIDQTFSATGKPFQKFRLDQRPVILEEVVPESLRVEVDGVIWTRVEGLAQADDGLAEVYEIGIDGTGLGEIAFGDGFKGKVPVEGATVDVRYRVGGGVKGNVAQNQVNQLTVFPAYMNTVDNPETGVGGQAVETTEHIKTYAPLSITEGGQLNTLPTIAAFLESQVSISRAKVTLQLHNKLRAVLLTAPGYSLDQIREQITLLLLDRLIMGFGVEYEYPTFLEVDVEITLYALDSALVTQVEQDGLEAVDTWLNPLAVDASGNYINDFGRDLKVSDLGVLLKEIDNIYDYEILDPTGNVEVTDDQIVTNRHIGTSVVVNVVGGSQVTGGSVPPVYRTNLYPNL
jgi:hypothetical protein